jgi:hypothetical protein
MLCCWSKKLLYWRRREVEQGWWEREREREGGRPRERVWDIVAWYPISWIAHTWNLRILVLVESGHYDSDFFQASQKDLTLLNAINLRLESAIGPYILSLMYNAHTYLLMHIPTYLLWHLPPYWGELNLLLLFELHNTAHYQCRSIFLCFFLMISYGFQSLIIIFVNVKFNLNSCTFHGHEKRFFSFFFRAKSEIVIKWL